MGGGGGLERREQDGQRNQLRQRLGARGVQQRDRRARDVGGLVVTAVSGECRERAAALGTLEQERLAVHRQHACRPLPVPPRHENAAEPRLGLGRDLEHGRLAAPAHGQQAGATGDDQRAIQREPPSGDVVIEHAFPAAVGSRIRAIARSRGPETSHGRPEGRPRDPPHAAKCAGPPPSPIIGWPQHHTL